MDGERGKHRAGIQLPDRLIRQLYGKKIPEGRKAVARATAFLTMPGRKKTGVSLIECMERRDGSVVRPNEQTLSAISMVATLYKRARNRTRTAEP